MVLKRYDRGGGQGSTDRPANGGSNGGAAVARAMAMPFFFAFGKYFLYFAMEKRKKRCYNHSYISV